VTGLKVNRQFNNYNCTVRLPC